MQNKLPLAKDRNAHETMPNGAALLMCHEISSTPEIADYYVDKLERKCDKAGLREIAGPVIALAREHRDNVYAQRDRENPYLPQDKSGDNSEKRVLSDFENFQRNLCKIGIAHLVQNIKGDIKINFAVSDMSEMVRLFLENGQKMGPKEMAALDKVLNYLLANENMVSKNGVIYESVDGKIREVAGKPVIADKERVAKAIEKLPEFLKDNNLQASIQRQKFPEKTIEAAKPIPGPQKPIPPVAPNVEVTPESPSTGVSSGR